MKGLIRYLKSESFFYILLTFFIYLIIHLFKKYSLNFVSLYFKLRTLLFLIAVFYCIYYIFVELNHTNIKIKFFSISSIFFKVHKGSFLLNILFFTLFALLFIIFCVAILFESSDYSLSLFMQNEKNVKSVGHTNVNNKNIGNYNNHNNDFYLSYLIIKLNSNVKGYFQKNYFNAQIIGLCKFNYNNFLNIFNNSILKNNDFYEKVSYISKSRHYKEGNINNIENSVKLFKWNCRIRIYTEGDNLLSKGDIIIIKFTPIIFKSKFLTYKNIESKNNSVFILKKNNNLFYKIRKNLLTFLNKKLNKWNASFLYSLLTGDRRYINNYIFNLYQKNQTSHLLALSGLHIGIIVNFFFFFLRKLLYNKKLIYFIITLIIFIFGLFVEFPYSVVRATIMFVLIILILFYERKLKPHRFIFSLALVGFLFLGKEIASISFILSISAIFSIFIVFNIIKKVFIRYFKKSSLFIDLFLVSFSITIFQSIVVIYYFKQFNFLSFIVNPFVILFVTISVYSGLIGIIVPFLSSLLFQVSDIFLDLSHSLNIIFFRLTTPFSINYFNIDKYFIIIILFYILSFSYLFFVLQKDYVK